jgi:uncharacterized protein (UPF0332 family)
MSSELISQARRLTRRTARTARQIDMKRGVSNAYYAMFHALAKVCADAVAGSGANCRPDAWLRAYRTLNHSIAKTSCEQAKNKNFPNDIVMFAEFFAVMQQHRHDADYNPHMNYTHAEVVAMIDDVELAIASLRRASRLEQRAFVVLVLFPGKWNR